MSLSPALIPDNQIPTLFGVVEKGVNLGRGRRPGCRADVIPKQVKDAAIALNGLCGLAGFGKKEL